MTAGLSVFLKFCIPWYLPANACKAVGRAGAAQQEGLGETIAGNLSLLASAINRLEFLSCAGAGAAQQPAPSLVAAAMPHLEATAQQEVAHRHPAITAALCKVICPTFHGHLECIFEITGLEN